MLEFLVDNIFVVFAGKVFQQIVGIPMGTNCAPLLADIFLYSYETAGRKHLASWFNFTYRYIDDVLSINNPEFKNYLGQMYPVELEIKDTTESNTSASYLDLLLSIRRNGQLDTSIYDKRDDFNFYGVITNFPFLSSNIQWQHPTDQTVYRTRPFTEFWVVSIEYLRRVWHADRGRLLLWTPGPVPLGLAYILLVETNPLPNLSLFYRTMLLEYPSVLSRFCFGWFFTPTGFSELWATDSKLTN